MTRQKKKAILVTGGAGFIGSHLVDELLKHGNKVIVADNFSSGKLENLQKHKNLIIYSVDVAVHDISQIFKRWNIETIYHLAAIPGIQFSINNPIDSHLSNIDGTFILLEHARKYGVKRFVFSSSSSVYGGNYKSGSILHEELIPDPLSPYASHKLCGEHYCKLYHDLYGIKTVSLRYFNVFGPRQDSRGEYSAIIPKFIDNIKKDEPIDIWNTGNQKRSFVSVFDVVQANLLAGKTDNSKCFGEVFNIGSPVNYSVNEIAKALLQGFNSKIKPIRNKTKVVEPFETMPDLSKSSRLLGWKPQEEFYYKLQELF